MGSRPECIRGFGFKIQDPVAVYERCPGWELQEGATEEAKKDNWRDLFSDSFYEYLLTLECEAVYTGHHAVHCELDPEVETYILHKDTIGWAKKFFPPEITLTLLKVAELLGVEYTPQLLDWHTVNYIG